MTSQSILSLNRLDKLCGLVSRTASYFRHDPIIVIDALDECADTNALLEALVALRQADIRLLVTSRPYSTIASHFTGLPSLSFDSVIGELAADIALHVGHDLKFHSQLTSIDPDIKAEIYAKLTKGAEGRFRWVQCQLDTLKLCGTRLELADVLDNLPREPEVTYERILEAIDERKLEGKLAQRALAWLVVALEPLHLAQIVEGFLLDFPQLDTNGGTQRLKAVLLDGLSSLVLYDEETDVLILSHLSVKEYLIDHVTLPMYRVACDDSHAEVVQTCMRYISAFLKQNRPLSDVAASESVPLLSYIFSSGFNHIVHVDPGSAVVLETLESLGSDVLHHPSHWDRLCERREEDFRWPYPPWPTSRHDFVLCILIAYAPVELLHTFLCGHSSLKPRVGTNPLVYAANHRKTRHAMVLLEYGVDVNARGIVFDDSYHSLPLEVAIDSGEDTLVEELLQREAAVTSELLTTAVCMPWCSARVLVKLVQTDEFVDWAHEIGDKRLYRGVFNSARPNPGDKRKVDEDHVALARRLRQVGQELSVESPFGAELIERAVHAAHTSLLDYLLPPHRPPAQLLLTAATGDTPETVSVVRYLLDKRIDIHAISDGRGDTALHLAAMCPWEPRSLELTKILFEAGCSANVQNLRDETPLTIAVERGYLTVAELLLSFNVVLPPDILLIALRMPLVPPMVAMLIQKGANANATTSDGDTVLHIIIAKFTEAACLGLARSLIDAGCDPLVCNFKGKSVQEAALERGYILVVELLLSCDTPLPFDILPTALRKQWPPRIIHFLIEKAVNVHATTSNGDTVLHLAVAKYIEPICLNLVKILIDAGCNPTISNSRGKPVLVIAYDRRYISVVELLLLRKVPIPLDIPALKRLTLRSMQRVLFFQQHFDILRRITSGHSHLLELAAFCCHAEMFITLLARFLRAHKQGKNRHSRDFL